MLTRLLTLIAVVAASTALSALPAGCGGEAGPSLDDFLPELPEPTGEPQSVFAGAITGDNAGELIPGPAAGGRPGDFFIRNGRARFVIESPTRLISISPAGGNLIDAVPRAADGSDLREDHFGELSMIYLLGRTCEHTEMEVALDGSGGGAAVLRARGKATTNDAINLKGIGLLPIEPDLDPDIEDGVECATTYILRPDSDVLEVRWTLFNPGDTDIRGPFGMLNDVGGEVEVWGKGRGFERLGLESLATLNEPAPVEYLVYQGPDLAYGMLPRHPDPATPNSQFFVSGISVVLYGADKLFDILDDEAFYLDLPARGGLTHAVDVSVGFDAADAEVAFRAGYGEEVAEIAGTVTFEGGAPAAARVAVFDDVDGDGAIGADDTIANYLDVDASGAFAGAIRPGDYLVRAEVKSQARSAAQPVSLDADGARDLAFTLSEPVAFDYSITDGETGNLIPGKITVFGRTPVGLDQRVFATTERVGGTVAMQHAIRGTTVDVGDGADPRLILPAGGPYRLIVSRGTEWSIASQVITVTAGQQPQELSFELRRVAPADGYVSADFHVHQLGSPDSAVTNDLRVATAAAEGVEVFAATDHNFVSDLQPVVEALGLERVVRSLVGIELTSFAYGHFNAFPMTPDPALPHNGAVDWARGMEGFAMLPGEIFDAARDRGAEVVQINHARTLEISDFLNYFDRAGLEIDYGARQLVADMGPIPNEFLRLPGTTLFDDGFNALEVWNRVTLDDVNGDGVREIAELDLVTRDWFGFLSLGMDVAPTGNSDTHKAFSATIGMPRTYVRVTDDSEQALAGGGVVDDLIDTLVGGAPRDIVVSNGPFVTVRQDGQAGSALGQVVAGAGGTVTFDIAVTAPDWAVFDTVEVFVNQTPEVTARLDALQPLYCFTSRDPGDLAPNDVCALATGGARGLTVTTQPVGGAHRRLVATLQLTVDAADVAAVTRAGASGGDAWLVVRVRGDRAIFPLELSAGGISNDNLDILVSGNEQEIDAALTGVGVPATAFTSPVYIDFDGGGYRAPFSPQ